ncbi:MAG: DUF1292 domain-containing protein [Bacilli bacterium]|nr:DUF1292 domain-containing protein [Bacilli bacterium]
MENTLVVSGENGVEYTIKVINIFNVDEFPNKEYIAYTFEEQVDSDHIKAYISILSETETTFTLMGISDKNEWELVEKSFKEHLMNNKYEQNAE